MSPTPAVPLGWSLVGGAVELDDLTKSPAKKKKKKKKARPERERSPLSHARETPARLSILRVAQSKKKRDPTYVEALKKPPPVQSWCDRSPSAAALLAHTARLLV